MIKQFTDWSGGVLTSVEIDRIPDNASSKGKNSALFSIGPNRAVPGQRLGCEIANITAISGTPAVLGMVGFKRRSGTTFTNYRILVDDAGGVSRLEDDDTTSAIATALTAGTYVPNFETANNLLFICNGQDRKKYNASAVQNWGITRPSAPTAANIAGAMTGTYRIALTYYNSATTHESSRSEYVSQAAAGQGIRVTLPTAGLDTQISHIRIHVLKETVQTEYFQLAQVSAGTATYDIDVSDAVLTALTTLSPNTTENDPPPSGITHCAWHLSRMFVAEGSNLYWSKREFPEAFGPEDVEPVSSDDGDLITCLLQIGETQLLIGKKNSLWVLDGDDPASWQLRVIDPVGGTVSQSATFVVDGGVFMWSDNGPRTWAIGGPMVSIGQTLLAPDVGPDNIAYDTLSRIIGSPDHINKRAIWCCPEVGQTRNNLMFPFNYNLGVWESNESRMIDICSMAIMDDEDSVPKVYLGDYKGRVFRLWDSMSDGARVTDGVTTFTRSGNITAATSTYIEDSTATFDTTGNGLAQLYFYVIDPEQLKVQRRRIGSNTATRLTLDSGQSWSYDPNTQWTYLVAAPDFQWDFKVEDFDSPFTKKRFDYFVSQLAVTGADATIRCEIYKNKDLDSPNKTFSFTAASGNAIWNESEWNTAQWAGGNVTTERKRISLTGLSILLRLINRSHNSRIVITGVSFEGQNRGKYLG